MQNVENKVDICADLVYNMVMKAWGSFFTDVSNHIEGYTNKADLDKDYADFLEDLHDWLPENCAAVTDAIGHLVREGSIEILESISGKVLEVIGALMSKLPSCVLEFLENRLVQGIMKVTGAVTQVVAGGALCATVAGAVAGVPMIILGLNQGIVGVQDIYHALKGDLDQPSKDYLKEITGHKIDNTLDLLTLISDTAAGMKATSMLKAAKAARAAKTGGRLSSEMSKLREALSKAKAGSKIAKALERKAARLVRKESRFVRMKNAVGRRIRAWRPEKPKPEMRVRPKIEVSKSKPNVPEVKTETPPKNLAEKITDAVKSGARKIWTKPADPIWDYLGPGLKSNPAEWNAIIQDLERNGVEIRYKTNGSGLAYAPNPSVKGNPGQILIDPDASLSALKHEYSHFLQAKEEGFPSMREAFEDVEARIANERKAYDIEIAEARKYGLDDVVEQLEKNFQEEVKKIRP